MLDIKSQWRLLTNITRKNVKMKLNILPSSSSKMLINHTNELNIEYKYYHQVIILVLCFQRFLAHKVNNKISIRRQMSIIQIFNLIKLFYLIRKCVKWILVIISRPERSGYGYILSQLYIIKTIKLSKSYKFCDDFY